MFNSSTNDVSINFREELEPLSPTRVSRDPANRYMYGQIRCNNVINQYIKNNTLTQAAEKLWPYFKPELNNWNRFVGASLSIILVPTASIVLPLLTLNQNSKNQESVVSQFILATAISVFISVTQESVNTVLSLSASMAINKDNVLKMTQDAKFLMHSNTQEISSLQYVTVGRAITDFTSSAIPVLIGIPTSIASSIATLAYIRKETHSPYSVMAVLAFVSTSVALTAILGNVAAKLSKHNLEIANKLVGSVNNIEAYKNSIASIKALTSEADLIINQIETMTNTIPKIGVLVLCYTALVHASPIISNNFLGKCYVDNTHPLDSETATKLNILIMSLISNAQNIALSLTARYPLIQVNLQELLHFDQAYKECLKICSFYDRKSKFHFQGNCISFKDFSVYVVDQEKNQIDIINKLNLNLTSNKSYKLIAPSGTGKTLFLNAIMQNWFYVDGEVSLPVKDEEKIYFIPKDSFIPSQRTLLEILVYPLSLKGYAEKYLYKGTNTLSPIKFLELKDKLICRIKDLFIKFNLYQAEGVQTNTQITSDDLDKPETNWDKRLSGGEKQRIGIIRALLTQPSIIIMDEATNAIDLTSKKSIFDTIKTVLCSMDNWNLIYTEHDTNTDLFADCILIMDKQTIEVIDSNDTTKILGQYEES